MTTTTSTLSTASRARGAMAGLALGDAIGRPVEAMTARQIQEKFGRVTGFLADNPAGSDDTEYALLTAKTLQRAGLAATRDDFAQTWIDDVLPQADNFAGGGFSEMAAIDNLRRGIRPPLSGDHIHSWSDGLAMRVAPIGIVANGDLALAKRLSEEDGMVSHSGEGIYSGVVVAVAVAAAMAGATARECFDEAVRAIPEDSWTARNLRDAQQLVNSGLNHAVLTDALNERLAVPDYFWADVAPEAVGLAMSSLLVGDGAVRESLLYAVNLGRDSDTNAAIAGCIAGAISGIDGFPAEWVDALQPVEGSCIRSMAGIHPLDSADSLLALIERASQ